MAQAPPMASEKRHLPWAVAAPLECDQHRDRAFASHAQPVSHRSLRGHPSKPALCARRKHMLESSVFRAWCGKPSVCLPPTPPLPPGVQRTDSRTGRPSSQLVGDCSGGAAVRDMGSTNGLVGRPRNPESPSGNGLKLSPGPGRGTVTERVQGVNEGDSAW